MIFTVKIKKCPNCKNYTLKAQCEKCNRKTERVGPGQYSPEDKYGEYRRKFKKERILKK